MIGCDGRYWTDEWDVIDRIASIATSTLANALDDAGWVVAEIDGVTRSVTLAHPRTGRTATIGIPMPR